MDSGETFGQWLAKVGVSSEEYQALPPRIADFLFMDFEDGDDPADSRLRLQTMKGDTE